MKAWDLTTGAAKLEQSLQTLQKVNSEIMEYWDDAVHRNFHEQHLRQLEPIARKTLDVIRRLEQVLARAKRDCGSY